MQQGETCEIMYNERWRAEPTNQRWVTSAANTCENDGQACSRNEGSGGGRLRQMAAAPVAHPCRRHCPCAPSARYPPRRCFAIDRRSSPSSYLERDLPISGLDGKKRELTRPHISKIYAHWARQNYCCTHLASKGRGYDNRDEHQMNLYARI